MPPVPAGEDDGGNHYEMVTLAESVVAKWANMPITEVDDLEYTAYLTMLKDAFIYTLSQTEEGKARLDRAWELSQEKPDRGAARALFG